MNTEKPTGVILFDHVLTADEYAAVIKQKMEDQAMGEHKHDGELGDGYTVAMHYRNIEIRDRGAEFVALTPEQAIKLLAWLEEEYLNLWRLVRQPGGPNDES